MVIWIAEWRLFLTPHQSALFYISAFCSSGDTFAFADFVLQFYRFGSSTVNMCLCLCVLTVTERISNLSNKTNRRQNGAEHHSGNMNSSCRPVLAGQESHRRLSAIWFIADMAKRAAQLFVKVVLCNQTMRQLLSLLCYAWWSEFRTIKTYQIGSQ